MTRRMSDSPVRPLLSVVDSYKGRQTGRLSSQLSTGASRSEVP